MVSFGSTNYIKIFLAILPKQHLACVEVPVLELTFRNRKN